MKKRAASLALVLSMILSFTCQAGAVDAGAAATETQLDAVKSVLLGAGMQKRQFPSDNDYIQVAKSLTIIGDDFKADAACTEEEKSTMQTKAENIGLKTAIDNGKPLFVGGVAQPIFRTRAAFRPRTATATIRATSSATRFTLRPITIPTATASLIW